ncbi:PREDICTED: TNF receptor-associated factor 3-like [Branchiostoma belcheri]|uniref:TNF receptor-associated factor 3-like n=1 Tax=Branchiostoma belcheri TaxID=7741 RepID=A0A6P5A1R8_BRABE|nr:PREDICTED: TNF receptor-associated factor 3-like [Branchiostoma belcheri]
MSVSSRLPRTTEIVLTEDDLGQEAHDSWKCCVCTNIMWTAMSLDCEHSLCESCVKQAVPPNCPMCRQEFETPRPNRLCRDILASMRAVCSLCRFTGTVGELVVHRAENCQRQMVYCRHEGCQETVERRHLDVHESTCCHRLEDCLCGMKIKRGSREEHSSTICPSEPIPCPLGCHSHITRGSAVLHTSQDCKRLVHLCRMPGCYFQGGPEEYRAHLAEASAAHVVLLEERLERVQTDCFMMDLKESDISFQRLETRMLVFHILHLKMAISRGSRRFVSPTCGPVLGGTWQVVLEQTGGAWKLYLCLVSRVRPILAKVMFALKAANTADYCIIGKGPRRMMENMRYGVQVPLSKLEAYSAENDGLRVQICIQSCSITFMIRYRPLHVLASFAVLLGAQACPEDLPGDKKHDTGA